LRISFFDSLRGFAMVLMAIYHFCFDLNYFGIIQQNMNQDPFWLWFRALIMTIFMGLIGIGLYLSGANFKARASRWRLIKIFYCALAISIVTYFATPESWIFFGVLHLAVLSTLLGPIFVKRPVWCLIVGIIFIVLPEIWRGIVFQKPILIVFGLSPFKPITEDFAPLFPWLGMVMIGVFLGWLVLNSDLGADTTSQNRSSWRSWEWPPLSRLGKHALLFYMIHQIILFPLAWLVSRFI
jgi:uncharacterized membrane protein